MRHLDDLQHYMLSPKLQRITASFFGSIVYNRETVYVYKCQNFLKVVVHVIIIDQLIKPRVRRNRGNGYL